MPKHKGKDKGSKKPPAPVPLRLRKHIDALGMELDAYLRWCADNGFGRAPDKSPAELEREAAFFAEAAGRNARIDRILQDPRRLIEAACSNGLDPDELSNAKWANFIRCIARANLPSSQRSRLQDMLRLVEERCDFVFEAEEIGGLLFYYVEALINLMRLGRHWIRPLEEWRPAVRSRRRQFSSLLRHLLAEYPVPEFMDAAWFGGENDAFAKRSREWFIHIGRGHNIRTATTPFPLTKRMAHCFLEAPDRYTPGHALRWGQVHALGGDRRLTEALLGTRLAEDFANYEFWQSAILFFVNHPMLDRRHVGPIVDFIYAQKFDHQEVMIAPGHIEQIPPPQPGFTMRGRTPQALLRLVEEWHEETVREKPAHGLTFAPWPIHPHEEKVAGSKDRWHIRQLLSGTELIKEGKALGHCVATYAESCAKGYCSIWSMTRETPLECQRTLTIEVGRGNVVVQVRGAFNRLATRDEFAVIRLWATRNGVGIGSYVAVQG